METKHRTELRHVTDESAEWDELKELQALESNV